jgi:hypothetical protein
MGKLDRYRPGDGSTKPLRTLFTICRTHHLA